MKKMFLLFSHTLTDIQIEDGKINFDIEEFVYLSDELQKMWSEIPSDLISLKEYLIPFKDFLIENSDINDVILIQGDFGAVYQMINFSKDLGLRAIYATTTRVIEEKSENGEIIKKSIFKHRRFREYE